MTESDLFRGDGGDINGVVLVFHDLGHRKRLDGFVSRHDSVAYSGAVVHAQRSGTFIRSAP
jgi:hypothetical protein